MNFFSVGGRAKTRRNKNRNRNKLGKPKLTKKVSKVMVRPKRNPQKNQVFQRKVNPVVSVTNENGIRVYHVRKIMTDKAIADKISEYIPSSHYSLVVKQDTDVWGVDED